MTASERASEFSTAAARAVQLLAADPRIRLVFVFGSAVDSSGSPTDLDLATELALSLDELLRLAADW